MQLSFALVSLAGLAVAAPLTDSIVARAPDNTDIILSDIQDIRGNISALNSTLNENSDPNYQYNFFQLISIQGSSNAISNSLNSTAGAANASAPASSSQSQRVYNAVNNGLKPDTISLLSNLEYHYPGLKAGGISGTVENNLQSQRELSRELGNALAAKASSDYVVPGNTVSQQILAKFDEAIAKFAN